MLQRIAAPKNGENGFTVVECLLAIFLLSFGILALSASQVTFIKSEMRSQCAFQANSLADLVFEIVLRDTTKVQPVTISGDCSGSEGFKGQICRALHDVNSEFMEDITVNVEQTDADIQTPTWRVTVGWHNFGASNSIAKEIVL